jgi:rfaE bifunctional protein nucleotidyltransferase chain/domain
MKRVATCGCFDIIHDAHVNLLKACRDAGESVTVFLNTDESISRLKGTECPILPFEIRAAVLRAIRYVDAIIPFNEDTPARAIREWRKSTGDTDTFFWIKGADARLTGLPGEEKNAVLECGGTVLYYDNPSNTHTSGIRGHITSSRKVADNIREIIDSVD